MYTHIQLHEWWCWTRLLQAEHIVEAEEPARKSSDDEKHIAAGREQGTGAGLAVSLGIDASPFHALRIKEMHVVAEHPPTIATVSPPPSFSSSPSPLFSRGIIAAAAPKPPARDNQPHESLTRCHSLPILSQSSSPSPSRSCSPRSSLNLQTKCTSKIKTAVSLSLSLPKQKVAAHKTDGSQRSGPKSGKRSQSHQKKIFKPRGQFSEWQGRSYKYPK